MNVFYRLLARCQQALWGVEEMWALVGTHDTEKLASLDSGQLRRDMLFLLFATMLGYGPLYSEPRLAAAEILESLAESNSAAARRQTW